MKKLFGMEKVHKMRKTGKMGREEWGVEGCEQLGSEWERERESREKFLCENSSRVINLAASSSWMTKLLKGIRSLSLSSSTSSPSSS